MKKLYYTLCLLVILGNHANAQQVLWSEDFEYHYQDNFATPWIVSGNVGSYDWHCGEDYIVGSVCFPVTGNTTRMAGVSDIINWPGLPCQFDHNDSDVLLGTPPINLVGYTKVAFRYDSYFSGKQKNGQTETATVEVSIDNGASWTVIKPAPISPRITTSFIDLSAYAGNPSVRLGFRYGDKGQHMVGWMIDNLQVFVPAQHDIALTNPTPADSFLSYMLVNQATPIGGAVVNMGAQPITSFKVSYATAGQTYTDTVNGVNIATFDTLSFIHSKIATVGALGRQPVKMWASTPGDLNATNDSALVALHGVSFFPNKLVTVEEGTGTWFTFGPQGHVYMDMLRLNDNPPALISMHDADDLAEDMAYVKYLEHFKSGYYIPFFFFDRRMIIDPDYIIAVPGNNGGVYYILDSNRFFGGYNTIKNYFGFADIQLNQVHTSADVSIEVTVKPAIDLAGAYRVALVLTEDGCKGTTAGYSQANDYSGGAYGNMGGYEALPDPVPAASMVYNAVGRGAFPAPDGDPGSLPIYMTHNQTYVTTLVANLKSTWKRTNMHAIVLLLRQSDGSVLNAAQINLWPLSVKDPGGKGGLSAAVYPNPASSSADVLFETAINETALISATDVSGKLMLQKSVACTAGRQIVPIRMDGWAAGMYFVTVKTSAGAATMKLIVSGQ